MPIRNSLIFALTAIGLTGCAATMTAIEKKDLKVTAQMSATIFFDIENEQARTVYLTGALATSIAGIF